MKTKRGEVNWTSEDMRFLECARTFTDECDVCGGHCRGIRCSAGLVCDGCVSQFVTRALALKQHDQMQPRVRKSNLSVALFYGWTVVVLVAVFVLAYLARI